MHKSYRFRLLVRIDSDQQRTHGYQARRYTGTFTKRGCPQYRSKLFSDGRWGGKRKARAAALRWANA